ncbi:manganese transporter Smf1p [[Candida] railenensis]|uniref:Manganese transporter Smf1p n=1 Tax=[Candida] railenensis TaxID=45579 RepID=A0A9P0VWQ7_9ASCO|nr:manganese transporter Smf1p [[Candida] railenensis]
MIERQPFHYNDSSMSIDDENNQIRDSLLNSQRSPQHHNRNILGDLSEDSPNVAPNVDTDQPTKRFSILRMLKKYSRFIGPGLMVSVAYMDPGNYSTAVAAGSAYKYKLLFSILLSNCLAIFLQILSAKLGAVTGLDLAANCRANLPFKYNIIMYVLAELAIIATDLAEVVGTAIALNILFNIPLLLGVIVTIIDVLIVLMAYRPNGPLLFIRIFEGFVSLLVALTVVCFTIELYQVSHDSEIQFSLVEVFKGFLPNEKVVDMSEREGGNGLFLSLAILGATVMPHSLYLGSGVVQSRLKDFDIKNGYFDPLSLEDKDSNEQDVIPEANEGPEINDPQENDSEPAVAGKLSDDANPMNLEDHYRPSIHAINDTMAYTMVELVVSLFTVALFVNSAILIVAGATLQNGNSKRDDHNDDGHHSDSDNDSDDDEPSNYANADLFTIYNLLSSHISPSAGYVFALALLFSGQSAGVVCTLAGQMVSEGFLSWSLPPVTRRLITRGLAIVPCIVVVTLSGREGLANVLNGSQVVLSVLLPVVTAPLIWFTSSKHIMRVPLFVRDGDEDADLVYDVEDDSSIQIVSTNASAMTVRSFTKPIKFKSTEPAIRLQDLRAAHPCAGWEEDEELDMEHRRLVLNTDVERHYRQQEDTRDYPSNRDNSEATTDETSTPISSRTFNTDALDNSYRVKGYKDMSNSPLTTFLAVLVWGFIASLNLFLIGSMVFGKEVPL